MRDLEASGGLQIIDRTSPPTIHGISLRHRYDYGGCHADDGSQQQPTTTAHNNGDGRGGNNHSNDTIMEKSKSLDDGMTGTANNANKALAKLGQPFGEAVKDVSNAITGLVEAALTSHVPSRRL
ncbi:uncharacterized protein LOC124326544 [Daphnia pulicaria]|uniref:uncharacterized protein LOC124326544 n=1 Tax=Daphnia pulicaria TaxID=35523 RepID=UPI001EEAA2E3|nr:uncharacterized protein LOC124326544 [Daphnia pulicaria]